MCSNVLGSINLENRQPSNVEVDMMHKIEEENVRFVRSFGSLLHESIINFHSKTLCVSCCVVQIGGKYHLAAVEDIFIKWYSLSFASSSLFFSECFMWKNLEKRDLFYFILSSAKTFVWHFELFLVSGHPFDIYFNLRVRNLEEELE